MFDSNRSERLSYSAFIVASIVGLYLSSLYSYLLFHSLIEISSISIGFILFILVFKDLKKTEATLKKAHDTMEERVRERTAELRESEENLRRFNEDLEVRVRERTAELERANIRLKELDRMKSMFIASMSHEIRTPLNSVIGYSRILGNEWTGPLNEEQKENLATILRSGKHLLSLLNDVIDVSTIEAGKIEPSYVDFDVFVLVWEAVNIFKSEIKKKDIELKVETIHRVLHSDKKRLLQCLLNLISNAVKFTEKGTISICAEIPDGGDNLKISVADTGIGIMEGDLGKLFCPFVRLDSPLKATVPGTGLGLYLSRKLAHEVLQGEISVISATGVGSRFVLTVPIAGADHIVS